MSALAAPLAGFETTPKPRLAGVGQASKTVHDQWMRAHQDAVAPMSRLSHPYQRVISLGMPVVPYILAELAAQPDHWFWALSAITGIDPVPEEAAGNLRAMTQAWLKWGDREGFID